MKLKLERRSTNETTDPKRGKRKEIKCKTRKAKKQEGMNVKERLATALWH